ncbi:uncharacterized protein LOC125283850 isoform X1 [Alosa alosa]|uniref:uncharacterized protein LOC125283850 isoform X1 n=1 Tax=Alosa alosa TaxID=278164 RepID=UPI0020154337|nr:uncharacterized protein LOC125283850 isoform X1 [Alosa alosa]XP_048083281.1 uncharacterized protein LOC125283850 isoform X1 [Alosa alosa]XP_048083282.1 uncharacterized protein LOC125283850 isoform X1 [Alosa alosa]
MPAGTSCTPLGSLEKSAGRSSIDQNNHDWNMKDNAMCSLPKDTTVASQISKEVSVRSSSMISQPLAVQRSQTEEIQLSLPSVSLDSTTSDQVSVGNGVYTANRSHSLPSFFPAIADEVMQYLTSLTCKERITQAVKNELKCSFSGNDLPSSLNLNVGPEERRAMRNMFKKVSKELSNLRSRERILSLWPDETTGPSSDHNAVLSQVNAVTLQLIDTVFSEVKEQLATEIKQESPKRGVSPLGCQTAIKAVCLSLEDMKMTLGNEMSIASASQMLRSVSSEKAVDPEVEKHGTVSSKEDNLSTSNSTLIDLDALAGFTKKVILKPTNVSTSKGVNTVAKVCPSLNDIALSCHQKNNYEDTLPYHKTKQSSSDGTVVQSQVDTMGEVTGAPSSLEVFKTEETQSVILQEAEVSSLEISSNDVETLAGASGALSGSLSPASSLDVFKTEEYLSVILQEAEVSTLEMSAEEIEMLAGASPALSGASSSSSSLEVFKTKQSRSVILQEATPEISSDEVKVLAGAISALSVTSSSPSNSQHSQSQEIQLNVPSFTLDSTGSDTNRVYTTTKTQSLPCFYPAIANEVSQYFTTTSFKDRITQAVKNELKRTFSVKELSSTPQPKLGPEERRAIRTMLKTVSQELNDLMSRENILSLLSVEIAACGSPEHDVLLDQLNAAASQQIEAVFNTVKENLAAKINQESSKRGVSPLASQTAMKAVCKSLEDIKMTLIGDEMCVTSTSGIQLSVLRIQMLFLKCQVQTTGFLKQKLHQQFLSVLRILPPMQRLLVGHHMLPLRVCHFPIFIPLLLMKFFNISLHHHLRSMFVKY